MDIISRSKFLSKILRHDPGIIGLQLDPNGWADVTELLQRVHWSIPDLDLIVSTNNKQRFEFSPDKTKIRACQGHSLPVNLNLNPLQPPTKLYHGTCDTAIAPILAAGIDKRSRTHVHLSLDYATALKVGSRHGTPIVLEVDSETMHKDGVQFFLSTNNVWLTDFVDKKYVRVSQGVAVTLIPIQNTIVPPTSTTDNSFF